MILEEESDSAHTTNVANGKNLLANSPNVAAVEERSIAARSAKRVLGYTIDTGAYKLHSEEQAKFLPPAT